MNRVTNTNHRWWLFRSLLVILIFIAYQRLTGYERQQVKAINQLKSTLASLQGQAEPSVSSVLSDPVTLDQVSMPAMLKNNTRIKQLVGFLAKIDGKEVVMTAVGLLPTGLTISGSAYSIESINHFTRRLTSLISEPIMISSLSRDRVSGRLVFELSSISERER